MSLREEIERRRATHAANSNATNKPGDAASAPEPVPVNETGNSSKVSPEPLSEAVASSPSLFLRLVKLNKQVWLLPWVCFHGVLYEPVATPTDSTDKCERLHLVFMRHEITVSGRNLFGIVDAIEEINLGKLCEVSDKYHQMGSISTAPLIMEINVKQR